MGYGMQLHDEVFFMAKEVHGEALKAIKELAGKETISDSSGRHFSWVDTQSFVKARYIEEAIKAWRWEVGFDAEGNINLIDFMGEKMGDDYMLFNILAPYIENGSYIEMLGEDGALWRWIFKNGNVKEVNATITFDE